MVRELYPLIDRVADQLKAHKKGLFYMAVRKKYVKLAGLGVSSQLAFLAVATKAVTLLSIALGGGIGVAIGMEILPTQVFSEVEGLMQRIEDYLSAPGDR